MQSPEQQRITVHPNWLATLVEKRDLWLSRRSGRRIDEALDIVRLWERDLLVVEVWVENGKIEKAKANALAIALEEDRQTEGRRA